VFAEEESAEFISEYFSYFCSNFWKFWKTWKKL